MKFDVYGPYEIPTGRSKTIVKNSDAIKSFWSKIEKDLQNAIGCYVFAIKASRGAKPYYVGKTEKSFKQEALHDHKIGIYNKELDSRSTGIPWLFLLPLLTDAGKISTKKTSIETRELESILIGMGIKRNADGLLNSRGTKMLRGIEVVKFMNPPQGTRLARRKENNSINWERAAGLLNVFNTNPN